MATKLHGMLNLSKIDKNLIFRTQKGDAVVFVDVVPNKNGEDEYGNTHAITLYNSETRETIYLGNLKPQEFGLKKAAPAGAEGADDLPF